MDEINIVDTEQRKIVFATPFYNHQGWARYIRSLFESTHYLSRFTSLFFDFWSIDSDSYVWRARNRLAGRFLESDFTEILFVDSDMEWNLEGLIKLLLREVPVVGAAYPVKNDWNGFTCSIETDKTGIPVVQDGLLNASYGFISAGFCKIQKTVFQEITEKRPEDYYISEEGKKEWNFFGHIFEDKKPRGEDVSFSVRCREANIPLYIEPDITITHYGIKGWTGNYHEFLSKQPKAEAE